MRLIDADAIPWEGFPNDCGEYHEDYVEKRVVDKMPTIEARPVRHGRWEEPYDAFHDMVWIVCSCCRHTGAKHFKYCPNCGADMRGEE